MPTGPTKERTNTITQLWHMNGKCPEDTIPIRRTKKEDVLRASSVKRYGKKKHRSVPQPRSADPDFVNESGHQVINVEHKKEIFISIFFVIIKGKTSFLPRENFILHAFVNFLADIFCLSFSWCSFSLLLKH